MREYEDRFTIHVDRENPAVHPVSHLLKDSPETIAAAAASFLVVGNKIRKGYPNESGLSRHSRGKLNPFVFFTMFLLLNAKLRSLKEFLFG